MLLPMPATIVSERCIVFVNCRWPSAIDSSIPCPIPLKLSASCALALLRSISEALRSVAMDINSKSRNPNNRHTHANFSFPPISHNGCRDSQKGHSFSRRWDVQFPIKKKGRKYVNEKNRQRLLMPHDFCALFGGN